MAMYGTGHRLKRAGREFAKNLAWMLGVFAALGAILVFATALPLLGVLAFVGIFASGLAAMVTVVALWSGAYDETFLSGRNDSGSSPEGGGLEGWHGGGWDGGRGDGGGGSG
jgi:hypothetical protein